MNEQFKTLAKKLGEDFSVALCKDSPYLESILKDLESLNQIFRDQSSLMGTRNGWNEGQMNQINSPVKNEGNQLT